jgi:hypothetical protein
MRLPQIVVAGTILFLALGCGGSASPPTTGPGGAPSVSAGGPTIGPVGIGSATAPVGGGPPTGPAGGAVSFQPVSGAGPTGMPAADINGIATLLGPGDFNGVGVPGAGTPTVNLNSGPGTAYVVYARKSAADGGIEFDVFAFDTAAEASANFVRGLSELPSAELTELGADQAAISFDELGNDPGTTIAEIRVLKGRIWFEIGIPSNPLAEAQLVALAKVVLQRAAAVI